ncbi:MAG: hypothetical protein ALAOOOJD_03458 [bacterium]|nr:hypothetical protein [bacterium]
MIFNPQLHDAIDPRPAGVGAADDENSSRLLAANIAADGLSGVQRREHFVHKIAASFLIRLRHRRPNFIIQHQIGLHGKIIADIVPRRWNALVAGVRHDIALRINHRDLAYRLARIGSDDGGQRLLRGFAGAH